MQPEETNVATVESAQVKKRPPAGMILLVLYLIYSIYSQVINLDVRFFVFGPYIVRGNWSSAYRLLLVAADATLLFAILKRKSWTVPVALGWYALLTTQLLVHLLLSFMYGSALPQLYQKLMPAQYASADEFSISMSLLFTFLFMVAIYGVICWYIYSRRSYFVIEQSADTASIDLKQISMLSPMIIKRAGAAFFDYLLYLGTVFVLLYLGYIGFWGIIGLWFLYFPAMEGMFGYTLFKGLFDLTLIKENRHDFRFFVALKRHLLDPIDFMFFGTVGLLMVTLRPDQKRLGDLFAHSRIAREQLSEPEQL